MSDKESKGPVAPQEAGFLQYGGQAVIEGVMMRSPRFFAVACRKPNGEIVVQREEVDKGIMSKLRWLNKPLLRGSLALIDAMALGGRALAFASNVQLEAEQQAGEAEKNAAVSAELNATAASAVNVIPEAPPVNAARQSRINDIAIGGTLVTGLAFGLMLFVLVPTALTGIMSHFGLIPHNSAHSSMLLNILDGVIRMVIFFGYIGLISMMPQIHAVFMYHGAEHKAINTLEAGLPLTRENALKASRIHPRCGTSFIFIVLVVNLIVFIFLPRPDFVLARFALHLAVVPLVAGLAYEVIKFAGRFRRNPLVMAIFAPGMWSQYLTTREPEAQQVDVALTALHAVLRAEGHEIPGDPDIIGIPSTPEVLEPAAAIA